jgi:hypothetical protein
MNAILSPITRFLDYLGPKLVLALTLLFALTLLAGIYLGRQSIYAEMGLDPKAVKRAQTELSALREALKVVRGDLEMQRTRHEVDGHALELLRSEMAAEKERTAALEEGLSFYRSMVVSDDPGRGLNLRKPELVPGSNPGRLRYRIYIQQNEREHEMVDGTLSVDVSGSIGGREISYPLGKLSAEFDSKAATLHFRYFQAIEGELVLPEGFEPRGMTLRAHVSKPHEAEVSEQFAWQLQERFINVGK